MFNDLATAFRLGGGSHERASSSRYLIWSLRSRLLIGDPASRLGFRKCKAHLPRDLFHRSNILPKVKTPCSDNVPSLHAQSPLTWGQVT